ncbi:hypothetical protein [Dysgonomonas sp. 520]|uniref:hypothetical protein n=1 Tax=Dysgonomonas sp. 520 TaxID=2302931 RepID=UPI0013D5F8C1|nr:hypothetical protein [Dysgonomonas sp. 520]NDW10693.1 hypothetical protein [Dysgonomonas sp. 520]
MSTNNLKERVNEIDNKLKERKYTDKEKHLIQEFLSRSIIANYYLKPQGYQHHIDFEYTNQFSNWDINIKKTHAGIEVKERETTRSTFYLEALKYENLLYCHQPYYVNYTLDDNKVYRWDISKIKDKIENGEIKSEISFSPKNTTIDREDKKDKLMYLLPPDLADIYTVSSITQFIDAKENLLDFYLTDNKIDKYIQDETV